MTAIKYSEGYADRIRAEMNNTLTETNLSVGAKRKGKVRDQYDFNDKIALITTDRQSAFDRVLAAIPFKGQVLNQTSAWWFDQTQDIIPNHVLSVPDPNVTLAKKCDVLPIEFVVRGYITGSTSTALWTVYNKWRPGILRERTSGRTGQEPKAGFQHAYPHHQRRTS